jgi:hypothetical protein
MILETLIPEETFAELNQDIVTLTNDLEEANSKNIAYLELNSQYTENKNKIILLKSQKITTRDLIEKIYRLEKEYSRLLSRKRYFLEELKIREKAFEKYSDKRGYLLTKAERKEKDDIDRQLYPLTKLEDELNIKNKKNEATTAAIEEIEQLNRHIAVEIRKQSKENSTLLPHIETTKTKLQYLQTFQRNQLILKKCIPIIEEKQISIDDDDDYEDIKNKCILDYADNLKYEGSMHPLCLNEECTGVNIGHPCQCGQNKNIWFTLHKPKSYENYITVKDFELLPELNEPLGYLITRDCSIDDYLEYAEEHEITYYNFNDLFISVNTHHHDTLRETYCVTCDEYPKNYNNYDSDSDNECYEDCYFDINSNSWTCSCGNRQFVWEDDKFDPMSHSLLNTKPEGSLRNEY